MLVMFSRDTAAQSPVRDSVAAPGMPPLVWIGSPAEDRLRIAQLRGAPTAGWMLRTPSSRGAGSFSTLPRVHGIPRCRPAWSVVLPTATIAWNSAIPFARNDGAMWAGRGASAQMSGGASVSCGRLRVHLVPEIWYAANDDFAVLPGVMPDRSSFSSPWYLHGVSADLPLRLGMQPLAVLGPGQSMVELDLGRAALGLSSEAQWWGPSVRNAIVMSNSAGGVPHAFLRTTRPVVTRVGAFEARAIIGALTESLWFDSIPANDKRSLSGLILTYAPAFATGLTVGASRVVYAQAPGLGALPARALDAVGRWGQGGNLRAATAGRAAEQLTAVFARFVVPDAGVESYLEWARVILPASVRALLTAPQYSQGFTVGLHYASAAQPSGRFWRAQAEATMLEQQAPFAGGDPPSFYVSRFVPQGYTQRGQPIGASIGPGSSSQWLAVDRFLPVASLGLFLGRIRWANDEFYRRPTGRSLFAQDVSVYAGMRSTTRWREADIAAELVAEKRMNFLFQSATVGYDVDRTFDVNNVSLQLVITPR